MHYPKCIPVILKTPSNIENTNNNIRNVISQVGSDEESVFPDLTFTLWR